MPTIVFISPKGGVGKTTAALVVATQLARAAGVAVIDADPNHPIADWAKSASLPPNLSVIQGVDEDNILETVEDVRAKTPFVVVDLEGTAAKIVLLAVSQADFVVIPVQGSHLDAQQAARAIRVIKQHDKMSNRVTPFGILLTRTSPIIRTRTMSHIQSGLESAGVPVLKAQLNEREAFRAMFSFSSTLEALDPSAVPNLPKAIKNAEAVTAEILSCLRDRVANGERGAVK